MSGARKGCALAWLTVAVGSISSGAGPSRTARSLLYWLLSFSVLIGASGSAVSQIQPSPPVLGRQLNWADCDKAGDGAVNISPTLNDRAPTCCRAVSGDALFSRFGRLSSDWDKWRGCRSKFISDQTDLVGQALVGAGIAIIDDNSSGN